MRTAFLNAGRLAWLGKRVTAAGAACSALDAIERPISGNSID
jgi:hypothetical protein